VKVFLIEAKSLNYGLEMNESVLAAGDKVVEKLKIIIDEYE
jgi:hypothetical protein